MREIAARPEIGLTATLEARGRAALKARATSAHEEVIAPGEFGFRRGDKVARRADVVSFDREMVSPGTARWRARGSSSWSRPRRPHPARLPVHREPPPQRCL